MAPEAKYLLLSADLVHGGRRSPFVHQEDVLRGTEALLSSYGIETSLVAPGVMRARCNGIYHPTLLVDNEDFFWQIPENCRKFQVRGMNPREWRKEGLVVLDANWAVKSVIADWVLQQYLVSGKQPDLFWNDPELSEPARDATRGFVAQGLDDLHRRKWYAWLQQP